MASSISETLSALKFSKWKTGAVRTLRRHNFLLGLPMYILWRVRNDCIDYRRDLC